MRTSLKLLSPELLLQENNPALILPVLGNGYLWETDVEPAKDDP